MLVDASANVSADGDVDVLANVIPFPLSADAHSGFLLFLSLWFLIICFLLSLFYYVLLLFFCLHLFEPCLHMYICMTMYGHA